MICNCPNTEPLASIGNGDCPFELEQVQKIGFQKEGNAFDSAATVPTDITLKADWDALISASDDTKVVITPFVRNLIMEPGDFITTGGGDNTTLNGIQEIEGLNPTLVTGQFKSISPAQEKALKDLVCHSLRAYLYNGDGKIINEKFGDTKNRGFKVHGLGVKDRRNAGFGTKDTVDIQFSLPPGWSENLEISTPQDFNPLYDL